MVACSSGSDDDDDDQPPAVPFAKTGAVYAVTTANRLVSFDPGTPGTLITDLALTGLGAGENIAAIDFRPSTGELYAFSSQGRLYRVATSNGDTALIGAGPLAPPLTGTEIGFDFNPVVDRLRLTTDDDENLRLHPDTGALVSTDTVLAYVPADINVGVDPEVVGVAYSNDFAGTTSTTLYGIDAGTNALVRIGSLGGVPDSPNDGELTTIGALGAGAIVPTGFDISPAGGAYLVSTAAAATTSRLFLVNLSNGGADLVGTIGGGVTIADIAVRPPTAPLIWALTATNRIVSFRPGTPGTLINNESIEGDLQGGELIVAIDIRPSNGELYGLGDSSRLYRIDKDDGSAHLIGGAFVPPLSGTTFDIDFNPTSDRLRVVSDTDVNFALDPTTGTVAASDTAITFAVGDASFGSDPDLGGIAYTNNFSGGSSTTVYGIDATQDDLVLLGSLNGSPNGPATGFLTTVGALGFDATSEVGLDASAYGALWAVTPAVGGGSSQLYSINPTTGVGTLTGTLGGSVEAIDLAIDLPAEALVVGLTSDNRVISFRPSAPDLLVSNRAITGLQAGEVVLAIDFRPSTSELYAIGSTSRLYQLNRTTGGATVIGTPFVPALNGTEIGMDFNPIFDPIRVVTDAGQNLRVNPTVGTAGVDTPLAYAPGDVNVGTPPQVTAIAYDDNFFGTSATTLYGIDTNLDVLVTVGSINGAPNTPNTGLVTTLGDLGLDAVAVAGFDISTYGAGFLALNTGLSTSTQLYSVNLTTGTTTLLGNVTAAGTAALRDLTLVPLGL